MVVISVLYSRYEEETEGRSLGALARLTRPKEVFTSTGRTNSTVFGTDVKIKFNGYQRISGLYQFEFTIKRKALDGSNDLKLQYSLRRDEFEWISKPSIKKKIS